MDLSVPLSARAQKLMRLATVESSSQETIPEPARKAAIDALARGETHYTDRPGILPLRQQVAEMLHARYGFKADPNTIVISCGDTEARFVAVQCLLNAGDALLCLENTDLLEGPIIMRDAKLVKGDETLERVKALYLTSDTSEALREEYLEKAIAKNWWVIFEVTNASSFHPSQKAELKDKVISIGALAKTEGLDSWRIGFFHAPSGEAPELRSFKQALTICTTSLSQYAALGLMEAS